MTLINDIALARLAPALFIDAADLATILLTGTDGATSGTTFTSASSDFESKDIDTGHVLVVGNDVIEVDTRTGATTLTVSLPRVSDDDDAMAPVSGSDQTFSVPSFDRQIAEAEAWVLGALGIDPDHPATALDETSIVNRDDVERLAALRTIARVYELAAARSPEDAALAQQASHWRALEHQQRRRTVTYIDRDQDGVPDATRRIDVVTFTRA